MKLTREQVDKIATLARLELADDEKDAFTRQISSILEYVDMLSEVDTSGIEPMAHSIPIRNVFGADVEGGCDAATREALLQAFPDRQADLLKVKAIFS